MKKVFLQNKITIKVGLFDDQSVQWMALQNKVVSFEFI